MKRCEKILAQMAVDLHNGIIPIMPAHSESSQSPYNDVCKYCDYKEVCLADEDTPVKNIENIKHSESLMMLGGEDNA